MNKLFRKMIAVLLVITMAGANLSIIGMYSITYALTDEELAGQTTATGNSNVEFNAYFEGGGHVKTESIDSTTAKLFVNVKVKNTGYLKNGVIRFENVNFKLGEAMENSNIQSIDRENNQITLKQLNNGSDVTIEIQISILNDEQISLDNFSKETKTSFSGTYIDGNGKEKSVSKEITNKLLWQGNAEVELEAELTKYIPYATGEQYGVLLQTKINSGIIDSKLPIKKTELKVQAPEINGIKPTAVKVIANHTKATNGALDGVDFTQDNYTYEATTGIVTITVSNHTNEIKWLKDVSDEYLVNFLFEGQEIYNDVTANGINTSSAVDASIEVYNSEKTKISESTMTIINRNTELGTIADFTVETGSSSISKGQIYANYEAQEKKEVSYTVRYTATVNSVELTDQVQFNQSIDKFLTSANEEGLTTVSGNNYVYNKTVKISEKIFQKMLGEEGTIVIYDASQNEIGTINKETSKDSSGNYVLDISSKNNNQLSIATSTPVTEGQIVIKIEKAIKTSIDYNKEQMKSFTKMKVDLEGKASTSTVNASNEISLKEPMSVAEVSISRTDLTTVVKNENVEIRATLDTSSEYDALYKNPTLKIKLPSYINKIDIKNYDIVMANGLTIKGSPKIVNDNGQLVINITLEGTQTEYTIDAEYKGAIIVLNTDLTVETLTPSNSNKIVMEWTNENDVSINSSGTVETKLNFVAPTGIVTANGIDDLLSISDESLTGEIGTYTDKRTATIYGKIINNYTNPIKNVVVLGRFPAQGNKNIDTGTNLGSTFSTSLKSNIVLSGIDSSKYTVYYSENIEATTDVSNATNGWSTTATTNAKSYLIVTNDYEMETGKTIDFSYNVEIPENLTHNNSVYEMYKVYYNNVSSIGTISETKTSSIVGLTTGQGPELTVELTSMADVVREGQIVKMKVTVKNTGSVIANNVKVNIPLPENATFIDYVTGNGFYEEEETTKTIDVGTIEVGETKQISYYIKIDEHIAKKIAEEIFPKEIINKVIVLGDDLTVGIPSNEYKMNVQDGKIALEMAGDIRESQVLKKGEVIEFIINVLNISSTGKLTNAVVTIPLADGTKYKSAVVKENWAAEDESTEGVLYDEASNTVKVNLGTLQFSKTIILKVEVKEFEGGISMMTMAKADGTEEHYSNIVEYMSEIIDLEISELSSTPKYVKEGDNVTYSLNIKNKGSSTVSNVRIIDSLPKELTFVKASYTYAGKEQVITSTGNEKVEVTIGLLPGGETAVIKIVAKAGLLPDKNDKEIQNKVSVTTKNFDKVETNTVTNVIEYYETIHNQENGENKPSTPTAQRYKITGTAWIDSNKNGKRDTDEDTIPDITVILLNKKDNSIVKDLDTGSQKKTTTNSKGTYEFNNLPQGEYIAIFLYDASKYSLTTYQEKNVDSGLNSDVINTNITVDGKRTIAGTTDVIKITEDNARDIDIGLYSAEKFDLKLDKYVSKITLTTPTIGTKTYDYDRSKIAKIEVLGSNLGKSNIVIEYKIVVTNEGAVAGYAKKIVDYLPEDVGFNTELNKDWYLSDNGNVYNASLANEIINPGESKEITLVVTKKMTEESLGTLNNNAEIYEAYNEQGLKDMDSTPGNKVQDEDDISQVDVVLSIVTGKIIGYTAISIGTIAILGFGIFEIKRRVLNKRKN